MFDSDCPATVFAILSSTFAVISPVCAVLSLALS